MFFLDIIRLLRTSFAEYELNILNELPITKFCPFRLIKFIESVSRIQLNEKVYFELVYAI